MNGLAKNDTFESANNHPLMKNILLFPILLLTTFLLGQEESILDEQFNDNSRNWYTLSDSDFNLKVDNGVYEIESKGNSAYWTFLDLTNLSADKEDFTIETGITQIDGLDNYGYGLIWSMYPDNSTYHSFLVSSNQMVKMEHKWKDGENKYKAWESNSSINKMGKQNILKIEKRANCIRGYLNGQLIYTGGDFSYFGSKVGFYVGNKMKIRVDYIKITKQPKQINLVKNLDPNIKTENLGPNINSTQYSEVAPVISADGKTLFCVRKGSPLNTGAPDQDDIWFATANEKGEWSELKNIGRPLNNESHNFVISVSPDNNTMLVANTYKEDGSTLGSGISITTKTSNGWEIPKQLLVEDLYNTNAYVSYFLGSDNKTLLLAIENKDGYGQKDIYVSFLKADNSWSKPMNLGNVVNSWGDESGPYLAADNITMYFSTNGHAGYGRTDVFVTKRLDDTWLNWSVPENLGQPINTTGDELGYYLTAKGDYAYLASGGDIFKVLNPERPEAVVLISGKVYNKKTSELMSASIKYYDLEGNKELGTAISHPQTGEYKIVLPLGKIYSFLGEKTGFYALSQNIDLKTLQDYKEINKDLYLSPIEKGQSIRLNNLFFEFAKADLKAESYNELDRLYQILVANPEMKIEIGGHTDDVGDNEYNDNLSKSRANAVMNYLLKKGIQADRLTAKGYGETKPEVPNTTEENKRTNRRVEFKII